MILIITHKADYTADFVINKLNQKKIGYKRLNCEDLLLSDYSLNINGHQVLNLLNENCYKSVWFRRTKLPEINGLNEYDRIYILNEIESLFKNLFSVIQSKWLSNPFYVYQAENKLLQLQLAKEIGLTIPPTLITNSKKELLQFYNNNGKNIIVKPISQTRIQDPNNRAFIFTNQMPNSIMTDLSKYDLTPCIYQKNIEKDYEIRVTVVDNKAFSAVVYSQDLEETKLDWRRAKLNFGNIVIPSKIEEMCIKLIKRLNISFGAIDLIKTKSGEYFFLEVNPNGQWVWIENHTGLKISEAIIDFLSND